jgi:hypothetical protein
MKRYLVTLYAEVDDETAALAAAKAQARCDGSYASFAIEEALQILIRSGGAPDGTRILESWVKAAPAMLSA